jgi:hypothetical protein
MEQMDKARLKAGAAQLSFIGHMVQLKDSYNLSVSFQQY